MDPENNTKKDMSKEAFLSDGKIPERKMEGTLDKLENCAQDNMQNSNRARRSRAFLNGRYDLGFAQTMMKDLLSKAL